MVAALPELDCTAAQIGGLVRVVEGDCQAAVQASQAPATIRIEFSVRPSFREYPASAWIARLTLRFRRIVSGMSWSARLTQAATSSIV